MSWKAPKRNLDGIQFAELRATVDPKFNNVHDELSECYYTGKPFRNYGVLDKNSFDKLHGLIFKMRDVEFHETNTSKTKAKRINNGVYNMLLESEDSVSEEAVKHIAMLKAEGFELEIE